MRILKRSPLTGEPSPVRAVRGRFSARVQTGPLRSARRLLQDKSWAHFNRNDVTHRRYTWWFESSKTSSPERSPRGNPLLRHRRRAGPGLLCCAGNAWGRAKATTFQKMVEDTPPSPSPDMSMKAPTAPGGRSSLSSCRFSRATSNQASISSPSRTCRRRPRRAMNLSCSWTRTRSGGAWLIRSAAPGLRDVCCACRPFLISTLTPWPPDWCPSISCESTSRTRRWSTNFAATSFSAGGTGGLEGRHLDDQGNLRCRQKDRQHRGPAGPQGDRRSTPDCRVRRSAAHRYRLLARLRPLSLVGKVDGVDPKTGEMLVRFAVRTPQVLTRKAFEDYLADPKIAGPFTSSSWLARPPRTAPFPRSCICPS